MEGGIVFLLFLYTQYLTYMNSPPIDYFCMHDSKLGLPALTGLIPGNLQLTNHNHMDHEELEDEELEQIR
jgi:hypothetical protein